MAHRRVTKNKDGTQLVLEPNNNPAAKTYQETIFGQSIPATMFFVDDVQKEYERLKNLDVKFTMEPTKVTGSTIAVLDDTCGNLIQIAQLQDAIEPVNGILESIDGAELVTTALYRLDESCDILVLILEFSKAEVSGIGNNRFRRLSGQWFCGFCSDDDRCSGVTAGRSAGRCRRSARLQG